MDRSLHEATSIATWMVVCTLIAGAGACQSAGGSQMEGPQPPTGYGPTDPAAVEPLAHLPADVHFAAATPDPLDLADRLGRKKSIEEAPDIYGKLVSAMEENLGANLLDPEELKAAGLDPQGPAGLFWPELGEETFGVFFEVEDTESFETFCRDALNRVSNGRAKLETSEIAGFDLYHVAGHADTGSMLVKGDYVFAIASEPGRGNDPDARRWAREIANQSKGKSFANRDSIQKVREQLHFGRDAVGLFNLESWLSRLEEKVEQSGETEREKELARKIEKAQKRGNRKRAKRYRRQLEMRQQTRKLQRGMQQRIHHFVDELVGDSPGVGIGVEVRDAALRLKAHMPHGDEKDLLAEMLKADAPTSAIIDGAPDDPLMLGAARLNLEKVMAGARALYTGGKDDSDFEKVKRQIKRGTSIDIDRDIVGRMTGELGLSVDFDLEQLVAEEGAGPVQRAKGGVLLGVSDVEGTRSSIERVVGKFGAKRFVRRRSEGRWRVASPAADPMRLRVSGGYLSAATLPKFHQRVVDGAQGSGADDNDHPASALTELENAALVVQSDVGPVGAGMVSWMIESRDYGSRKAGPGSKPSTSESEALEKSVSRYREVREKLQKLSTKRNERSRELALNYLEQFGATGLAARSTDQGVSLYYGKYVAADSVAAGVADYVKRVIEYRKETRDTSRKIDRLSDEYWNLRREIRQLEYETRRKQPPQPKEKDSDGDESQQEEKTEDGESSKEDAEQEDSPDDGSNESR